MRLAKESRPLDLRPIKCRLLGSTGLTTQWLDLRSAIARHLLIATDGIG
jgi:hypothetical protein